MQESFTRDYHLACLLDGWAFTQYDATVTPTGAADVFCKIQNNSADLMIVTGMRIYDAGAEIIDVQLSPAYTSAGASAAIVPINRYSGSANLAATKATCESDANITGDTGVTIHRLQVAATTEQAYDWSDAPIVVGTNQAFILEAATGTAAIRYEVDFYFATVPYIND
jgi:hypothetical protein